jgi:formylglycine-generating enzyme required for sulfatase activity
VAEKQKFQGFFSYAHLDGEIDPDLITALTTRLAQRVTRKIINAEFAIWRDLKNLRTGQRWDDRIGEAVRGSRVLVVLMTPKWFESAYCRKEYEVFKRVEDGLGVREFVVPILAHSIENQLQYFDPEQRATYDELNRRQYRKSIATTFLALTTDQREVLIDEIADDIENMIDRLRRKELPGPEIPAQRYEPNVQREESSKPRDTSQLRIRPDIDARKAFYQILEQSEWRDQQIATTTNTHQLVYDWLEVRLKTQMHRALRNSELDAWGEEVLTRNADTPEKPIPAEAWDRAEIDFRQTGAPRTSAMWRIDRPGMATAWAGVKFSSGQIFKLFPLKPLAETRYSAPEPGDRFRDFEAAPEMVVVPAGEFMMGSPIGVGDAVERPQHKVTIASPFAVSVSPITRGEFEAFVNETGYHADWRNPGFEQGDDHPVVMVSWHDAQAYLSWLKRRSGGKAYRLLSEAEWEYCCRAGTTSAYSTGDRIAAEQANFEQVSKGTTPVSKFPPNPWGLQDMHGNVWEWCEDDWHANYEANPPTDGSVWTGGDTRYRVVRGGFWNSRSEVLRSANRMKMLPGIRIVTIGFRVARPR